MCLVYFFVVVLEKPLFSGWFFKERVDPGGWIWLPRSGEAADSTLWDNRRFLLSIKDYFFCSFLFLFFFLKGKYATFEQVYFEGGLVLVVLLPDGFRPFSPPAPSSPLDASPRLNATVG